MTAHLWILLSLGGPAFWAGSNIIDQMLIRSSFKPSPLTYVLFQGSFYVPVLALFPLLWPETLAVSPAQAGILMVLGQAWIVGTWAYISALKHKDASIAVPLYNMVPFMVLIGGWIFLHETISGRQFLGGCLIVAGAAALVWDFQSRSLHIRTLLLMLIACASAALYNLVARAYLADLPWTTVFFWYGCGFTLTSLAGLLLYRPARAIFRSLKSPYPVIFSGLQAWLDVAAISCITMALALTPTVSIVSFLASIMPVYILIATAIAGTLRPDIFDPFRLDRQFVWKLVTISVIMGGIYLLLDPALF